MSVSNMDFCSGTYPWKSCARMHGLSMNASWMDTDTGKKRIGILRLGGRVIVKTKMGKQALKAVSMIAFARARIVAVYKVE